MTGTAQAATVHRTDQLAVKTDDALPSSPSAPEMHVCTPRKHKRENDNNNLLAFLKESEERGGQRQDLLLDEMVQFRGSFMNMFDQLLNKL